MDVDKGPILKSSKGILQVSLSGRAGDMLSVVLRHVGGPLVGIETYRLSWSKMGLGLKWHM
jgi:hypothetical protein